MQDNVCQLNTSHVSELFILRHSRDFEPRPRERSTIPVISNLVVAGLPEFFRREVGERAVGRAMRRAGVDLDSIEGRTCFIPHAAVIAFIDGAGHVTGDSKVGLLIAPFVDVATYGVFGQYILGADTLGAAIRRCIHALGYHSHGDAMALSNHGTEVRFSYRFALSGQPGYSHVAPAAAGVLLSLCRHFLPANWRPLRVEIDIPKPPGPHLSEDLFGCPVIYDAQTISIVLRSRDLSARARLSRPIVTLADVARDRSGPAPRSRLDVMIEQVRIQVRSGSVSVDDVARAMDISVRSLQRELNASGVGFRQLVNLARHQRAVELIQEGGISLTQVATELGYASPANFSRAFRRETGFAPRDLREKNG